MFIKAHDIYFIKSHNTCLLKKLAQPVPFQYYSYHGQSTVIHKLWYEPAKRR